ncbi:MAG: alkaline phosphatase [Clostridia bacterium]|nr:alkaline phosphatase [Clostridia bacterium]
MKKSFFSKLLVVTLTLTLVAVSLSFVACNTTLTLEGSAKNVILLIGDGMGLEHLEATKAKYGLSSLALENLTTFNGEVTTNSLNSEITDSAASSTAYSCGVKTNNMSVAQLNGENLENMDEFVAKYNMDMGIVVTETIVGGTPSSFASHAKDRDKVKDIFDGYMASDVDLFISEYDQTLMDANTGGFGSTLTRENSVLDAGYTRLTTKEELTENAYSASKIFATVNEFNGYGDENGADLAEVTSFAINYLSQKSDNGFFLMVESSHIDKFCHKYDFDEMAKEVMAFDMAIQTAIEWAKADGNTIVIVTADHETGGLVYNPGDALDKNLFKTGEHSTANVGVFIYGFNGGDSFERGTVFDNVEIGQIIRQYIKNYRNK